MWIRNIEYKKKRKKYIVLRIESGEYFLFPSNDITMAFGESHPTEKFIVCIKNH